MPVFSGGSSRFIYRALSDIADADGHRDLKIEVVGITLSQYQRDRAAKLTADDGDIPSGSVTFQVANALDTNFPNEHFDCVWSLESGEHMPDKDAWLTEVERVLTPGGTFLCASWCRRETDKTPLSVRDTGFFSFLACFPQFWQVRASKLLPRAHVHDGHVCFCWPRQGSLRPRGGLGVWGCFLLFSRADLTSWRGCSQTADVPDPHQAIV